MNLYEILGVEPTATKQEIKAAYKLRAQKTHPDREGGNEEEFQSVLQAYEILYNSQRREQYDLTGEVNDDVSNIEVEAAGLIITTFMTALKANSLRVEDYADLVSKKIKRRSSQMKVENADVEKGLEKVKLLISKLESSDDENLMLGALETMLAAGRHQLNENTHEIEVADAALIRLTKYGFKNIEEANLLSGIYNEDLEACGVDFGL